LPYCRIRLIANVPTASAPIMPMPAARPSRPSTKFIAFTTTTVNSTVSSLPWP